MNGRLANARAITKQFLYNNFRPEVACDIISGGDVEQLGMSDSRTNHSRYIRLPHFVTNNGDDNDNENDD